MLAAFEELVCFYLQTHRKKFSFKSDEDDVRREGDENLEDHFGR
jgi:hypothetical protein